MWREVLRPAWAVLVVSFLSFLLLGIVASRSSFASNQGVERWSTSDPTGPAALCSGTWVSSIQVQNLGATTGTVQVDFYDAPTGTLQAGASTSSQVPAGALTNIYLGTSSLPSGFRGSAVVSSDQPIGSIGNLAVSCSGGISANSSFGGVNESSADTVNYLPLTMRKYGGSQWDTQIIVQNATSSTITATVDYYDSSGNRIAAARQVTTLAGYAARGLNQADNAGLSDGYSGSAVVTGTGKIATIVNEMAGSKLTSYNGFASGGSQAFLPLIMKNFGGSNWVTSFQVMNVGSTSATVVCEYFAGSAVPSKTVTTVLSAFTSLNRYQPSADSDLPSGWIGAVRCTAASSVVAIGNQSAVGAPYKATTYNGFITGTTTANLPLIMKNYGGSNWVTSFQVMNTVCATANVTMEYFAQGSSVAAKTVNASIPCLSSINRYQPVADADLPAGWIGAVRVTADKPVVTIGNETALNKSGDPSTTYNGM